MAGKEVLGAIERNRAETVAAVIDADSFALAICNLAAYAPNTVFFGTATQLLARLAVHDEIRKEQTWPKSVASLSMRLNRIKRPLRSLGIEVETGCRQPGTGERKIKIWKKKASQASQPSQASEQLKAQL